MKDDRTRTSTAARFIVALNCAACLAFGAASWLIPARVAQVVDVSLTSPTASADFRAMYGGLCLAIAALLWQGLRNPDWFAPSLFLTAAMCGALATARIYSSLVDGIPNTTLLIALATEIVSLIWALIAYRGLQARQDSRAIEFAHELPTGH